MTAQQLLRKISGDPFHYRVAQLLRKISGDRHDRLYGAVGWITGLGMIILGAGYALGGTALTPSPRTFGRIMEWIPGGMHTYGVAIFFGGFLIVVGLLPVIGHEPLNVEYLHNIYSSICAFNLGIAIMYAIAWAHTGIPTFGSIVFWTMMFLFPLAAFLWPPDQAEPCVS